MNQIRIRSLKSSYIDKIGGLGEKVFNIYCYFLGNNYISYIFA
jgi:hypothetical protein